MLICALRNCMQLIKIEKFLLTLLCSEFNGNMPHALNIHEFHICNMYILLLKNIHEILLP